MPINNQPTKVEYMCSWCGTKISRKITMGKPVPGNCPRKPKTRDGKPKPHTWVINRKY